MARAKRTHRAEARRRFRQTGVEGDPEAGSVDPNGERVAAAAPPARRGIGAAARDAYRPAHVREDVAALPTLVRHWSFWVPILLIIGGAAFAALAPESEIAVLLFQSLVVPPAMAGVFIVGFFAPRGAYLLGGIISTIDVIVYSLFFSLVTSGAIPGIPVPTVDGDAQAMLQGQLLSALTIGPISGVLFGAAAAWYKRFLTLSNPNRGRPQSRAKGKASGRPAPGRR